jgi:endonuclease YncB( thermonuclease family)
MSTTTTHSYPATVTKVVDGDTLHVTALIFPTPRQSIELDVRLAGVNAREHSEPGGPEAAAHLAQLIGPLPAAVQLDVVKLDKYGRLLALVTTPAGVDVAHRMVTDGYAAPWDGNGKKPVPAWPIPTPTGGAG